MRSEKELLIDCLQRLNRSGISYMLTGSMASNCWGIPRTTHDLDFVLVMQPADVASLVDAFPSTVGVSPRHSNRAGCSDCGQDQAQANLNRPLQCERCRAASMSDEAIPSRSWTARATVNTVRSGESVSRTNGIPLKFYR
jgi:hypothetical protein